MAIVQVSVVPLGTGTPSLSRYVAQAHRILESEPGIKYQLTPMSTVIEGELDWVLAVIRKIHESAFDGEVRRVLTAITIDDRRDKPATMESKVAAVQEKLQPRH